MGSRAENGNRSGLRARLGLRFHEEPGKTDQPRLCSGVRQGRSPLVMLTAKGTIYWPIADTTPSSSQNDKLIPFAGQKVTASGKVFERGGSHAFVIEKIAPLASK
jgi:hypothetical protein